MFCSASLFLDHVFLFVVCSFVCVCVLLQKQTKTQLFRNDAKGSAGGALG